MDIQGSRVLLLGGTGPVGMAIARQLLRHSPARIVLSGLTREEAESAARELQREAEEEGEGVEVAHEWGDVFVAHELKDLRRAQILGDSAARARLLDDLYAVSPADAVERSTLGRMLLAHQPQIVVDCINTATVFAYQNVFASAAGLLEEADAGTMSRESVERHLATVSSAADPARAAAAGGNAPRRHPPVPQDRHRRHRGDGSKHPLHPLRGASLPRPPRQGLARRRTPSSSS